MSETRCQNPQQTYYKAVREDGTDFATGETRPVVGVWMPRIEGDLVLCERGYHVSDAPGETLIGGWWPCRLFEVEIPEGDWAREGHKIVVPTYRPTRELPAWQALGPNGEAIAALIERCRTLTQDEANRLRAASAAARDAAGDAAWAARAAAWVAACEAAWAACDAEWATRDAAWAAARDAARAAAGDAAWAAWDAARAAAWAAARDAAWNAARDAVLGLVVRDLITPEQFDALYGPWASVMGEAS